MCLFLPDSFDTASVKFDTLCRNLCDQLSVTLPVILVGCVKKLTRPQFLCVQQRDLQKIGKRCQCFRLSAQF